MRECKNTKGLLFFVLAVVFQAGIIVCYAFLCEYADATPEQIASLNKSNHRLLEVDNRLLGSVNNNTNNTGGNNTQKDEIRQNEAWNLVRQQPMFQDVNVMIFIGFGFLMTFMRSYSLSAVSFNFFLSVFTIEFAIIINGVVHELWVDATFANFKQIYIDNKQLILALFACGAVLISMGAVLGKLTHQQMLFMAFIEVIVFAVNEQIGATTLKAVDMGGSIFVHTFGAQFGLAVSRASNRIQGDIEKFEDLEQTTKHNDLFSMVGTIFLWMFWPSFNGALAPVEMSSQHRVVINTTLALTGSGLAAFVFSMLLRKKFSMEDIQNATLAGGVAIGSSSDLVIKPYAAIIVGFIAGSISTLGQFKLKGWLQHKFKLHDSCGVNNLHGMPGLMGGLYGGISAMVTSNSVQGVNIANIFEARGGENPRTAVQQGLFQWAALGVTLVISIVSGTIVGCIVSSKKLFEPYKVPFHDYNDIEEHHELPDKPQDYHKKNYSNCNK